VQHAYVVPAETQCLAVLVVAVDRRLWLDPDPEHVPLLDDVFVQELVARMKPHGNVQSASGSRNTRHVIEVGMRQQDVRDRQLVMDDRRKQFVDLIARVNDDAFAGVFASDDEPILEEGLDGPALDNQPVKRIRCRISDG
jgi:hypothetical protein